MVGNNNIVTTSHLFGRRLLRMATKPVSGADLPPLTAAESEKVIN